MFTSKRTVTAREVGSAHAKLTALLATRDSWYDGTIESVDTRLLAVTQALSAATRVADRDPDMLAEAEKLRRARRDLHALRSELLSNTTTRRVLPRKSSVGPLTREARRFIDLELRQFLADNADAVDDPDELDERAEDFAELATFQMPVAAAKPIVSHFRLAVNWASKPKKAPAPTRHASVEHLPDEMLFGG